MDHPPAAAHAARVAEPGRSRDGEEATRRPSVHVTLPVQSEGSSASASSAHTNALSASVHSSASPESGCAWPRIPRETSREHTGHVPESPVLSSSNSAPLPAHPRPTNIGLHTSRSEGFGSPITTLLTDVAANPEVAVAEAFTVCGALPIIHASRLTRADIEFRVPHRDSNPIYVTAARLQPEHSGGEAVMVVLKGTAHTGIFSRLDLKTCHYLDFFAEEWLLSRVQHANIVRALGLARLEQDHWSQLRCAIVLEYAPHGTLRDVVLKGVNGRSALWPEIISIVADVADVLQYLRDQDIAHNDVTWNNILVFEERDERNALHLIGKLADFAFYCCYGVDSPLRREITSLHQCTGFIGTKKFAAPENHECSLTSMLSTRGRPMADVYGLGSCLRHVIDERGELSGHMRTKLDSVVAAMTAEDPHSRWQPTPENISCLRTMFDGDYVTSMAAVPNIRSGEQLHVRAPAITIVPLTGTLSPAPATAGQTSVQESAADERTAATSAPASGLPADEFMFLVSSVIDFVPRDMKYEIGDLIELYAEEIKHGGAIAEVVPYMLALLNLSVQDPQYATLRAFVDSTIAASLHKLYGYGEERRVVDRAIDVFCWCLGRGGAAVSAAYASQLDDPVTQLRFGDDTSENAAVKDALVRTVDLLVRERPHEAGAVIFPALRQLHEGDAPIRNPKCAARVDSVIDLACTVISASSYANEAVEVSLAALEHHLILQALSAEVPSVRVPLSTMGSAARDSSDFQLLSSTWRVRREAEVRNGFTDTPCWQTARTLATSFRMAWESQLTGCPLLQAAAPPGCSVLARVADWMVASYQHIELMPPLDELHLAADADLRFLVSPGLADWTNGVLLARQRAADDLLAVTAQYDAAAAATHAHTAPHADTHAHTDGHTHTHTPAHHPAAAHAADAARAGSPADTIGDPVTGLLWLRPK